jgi:hypothetical protein
MKVHPDLNCDEYFYSASIYVLINYIIKLLRLQSRKEVGLKKVGVDVMDTI